LVSKRIVQKAKEKKQAIVLERLKGIRYVHQRGNRKSRASRRRIALWPFRELQHQIEYKAGWKGVQVEYVSAAYTSKECNECGFINHKLKLTDRVWRCQGCGVTLDRELNAAINIERRGKIPCLPMVRAGARGE
jgi:putative transposase